MVLIRNEQELGEDFIQQIMETTSNLAEMQEYMGLARAFFNEHLPELEAQQSTVNDADERSEENTNTTSNTEENDTSVNQGNERRVIQTFHELKERFENLQDRLEEVMDLIEQEREFIRLEMFQRDLDNDRHLGGF